MIHIRNLPDCLLLTHDPDLQREVISYMLYCRYEFLEYEDKEDIDDQDFNFMVLNEEDLPMLNDLGSPEETVKISIKEDGQTITIYRIPYPTTVLFIPSKISDQISL